MVRVSTFGQWAGLIHQHGSSLARKSFSFPTPMKIPSNSFRKFPSLTYLDFQYCQQFRGLESADYWPCLLFHNNTSWSTLSIYQSVSFKLTGSIEWFLRAIRVQFLVRLPRQDSILFENLPP